MDISLRRSETGLAPADQFANNYLERLPIGREVTVTVWVDRNPLNTRAKMAKLRQLFSYQQEFDDANVFRKWLIVRAGYAKLISYPSGKIEIEAQSMSEQSMDEVTFNQCFSKCVQYFIDHFGGQLDKDTLDHVARF